MVAVTLLMFLIFSINMASLVYYLKYYIKKPGVMAIGGLLAMSTIAVALLTIKPLVNKLGKRRVLLICVGISAAALVARVFLKDHNIALLLITLFLTFISYGAYSIIKMSLLFDSIEHAEYKTGISAKSIGGELRYFYRDTGARLGTCDRGICVAMGRVCSSSK